MNIFVDVKILDPRAKDYALSYATEGSAGLDLCAVLDAPLVVEPFTSHLVPTGISIHIKDPQYVGLILPRSGLGHKKGLVLGNGTGVIDADYQGPLMMSLCNRTSQAIEVLPGDRVAQLLIVPVVHAHFNYVEDFSEKSSRGEGGFGSTGVAHK